MPKIAKFDLSYLTQRIMRHSVLRERQQREFANKFAADCRTQNFQRKVASRGRRTDNPYSLESSKKFIDVGLIAHLYVPASVR
jgi:hypothetical protein